MSDDLKDAAIVVFGLALLAGLINHRAEHAITHDLARSARGGELHAVVNPRGLFGILVGQASSVRVTGRGFASDTFPWRVQRGDGLRAYVRRLDFDFSDITLRGIPVRRFTADVPNVTLDAGRAFFDERIIVRAAGEGRGEAVVDAAALERFLSRKFRQLSDVRVTLHPGEARVQAKVAMLGNAAIEATGRLAIEQGRYVTLVEPRVLLNGKELAPAAAAGLLKSITPVLDADKDLGLGGFFYGDAVEIGEGTVMVRGRVSVPRAEPASQPKPKPEVKLGMSRGGHGTGSPG